MSCISKMTIQGIRSYGPKDQDTQVIEFFTPVTLIIGQNGSGKTTIIECLKYACTSDMPPNTKGGSFLFDPKLIDEIETKGRIKLFFKDMSGLQVQVQKNMCLTQKMKKLEFRTLETIISRYDTQAKLVSTITSKCLNADAEVINALGVSKAVLDYVIFCHQEDSNWPLSDGKLLKTRFDEIFSATKYIKALDVIKKVRLEKQHVIKQMQIEWKHLENYKVRSDQLNRDYEEFSKKHELLSKKKEEIKEKLKPVQKQIDYFLQEAGRIFEIKNELDKIENERCLLEKQIKELLASTKDCLFVGDDEELREHIKTFTCTTNKMRREEEEATNEKIAELNAQLRQLAQTKSKLTSECGAMENKFKTYLEKKKQLSENAAKMCRLAGLNESEFVQSSKNGGVDTQLFSEKLNEFVKEYLFQSKSIEDEFESQEVKRQAQIDAERDVKSKLYQSVQNKLEAIEKFKRQLENINEELSSIENDKMQTELTSKIGQCEQAIAMETEQLGDSKKVKAEIVVLEQERVTLKEKETKIDSKINKWHQSSKLRTELNMLKNDKKAKQEQIRKIKLHIDEDFANFFEHLSSKELNAVKTNDAKLKSVFEAECRELVTKAASFDEKRKDIEKRLCSTELKRKMLGDDLRSKQTQLRDYEDKLLQLSESIVSESDIDKFESILEQLQEQHLTLLDEKGFLNGTDKTYKRFLQQLQPNCADQSCPVCMRLFVDVTEMNETIAELRKYTNKLPAKISDIEEKIKQTQSKLTDMQNARSVKEAYDRIKNEEIIQLKSQCDIYDRETLPKLRAELKQNETQLKEIEKRKQFGDQLQNEIVLIDKYASECAEIEKKVEQLIKSNPTSQETKEESNDLDDLSMHKSAIQAEFNQLNKTIKTKQDEISSNYARTDHINSLTRTLNELKARRTELTIKSQKKNSLHEKTVELEEEISEANATMDKLNSELKESQGKLCCLIEERQEISANSQKELRARSRLFDEIKELHNRIRDQIEFVKNYEKNDDANLNKLRKNLKEAEINERGINAEIEQLRSKLDEIKTELARHDIKSRELNDNLRLREKREEYQIKNKQYAEKKEQMQLSDTSLDLKNFRNEQKRVELKRDELNKELAETKNSLLTLEGRLQGVREEMSLDNHTNALEKFQSCSSDLKVLELAVLDMDKYYKALDKAIMSYHSIKMSEINKSIKQLWRQVYRGNDIDYVEIRSEEESPNDEQAQIKTRRSYNYRVVLIKGETCLDMRGRCSAGQKVLASIIIRLALAETFCLNSGILALDEPTTNLDRENIESLASALVEIIKTRSTQRNFQLLIITHDEDFVEMLGRSEYMDQFYRVSKDENGFSKIAKRSNLNL